MKFKANIFLIVLLLTAITAYSQIDSLENRKIYNWKLNSYDLSLELVEVDTTLESFQNFNPLLKKTIAPNYLGNLGTAVQSRIYYDRRKFETGFLFSESYGVYFHLPKDQLYYNTKSPFTLVNYSTGGPKEESEQVLGVLHTQNVNKDFNFGFDYDLISSDGRYLNQEVKNNSITIFSSYTHKGYRLHTNLGLDKIKAQENGGIDSLHYLGDDDYKNRRNIPVRLSDAGTKVSNTHIYLAQEYSFGKTVQEIKVRDKVIIPSGNPVDKMKRKGVGNNLERNTNTKSFAKDDTLGVDNLENGNDSIVSDSTNLNINSIIDSTYLNKDVDTLKTFRSSGFSIAHELTYNSDIKKFYDDDIEETFYDNRDIFIDSAKTSDEVSQKQFLNKVSLNYKYSDKFSMQLSFSNEQLKYKYNVRPDTLSIDTLISSLQDTTIKYGIRRDTSNEFSNNRVSGYMKALLFNKILFKGYGEYYITGYKKENSKLDLQFAYILWKDTELSLEGNYSNKRPNYFYENLTSNNFKWNNEHLRRIEEWDVGFAVRSHKYKFEAKVTYGQISNYLYLDTTAYVSQYRGQINLMVGELSKRFKLGPINTYTRFVYQKSTNDSILSLPEYSLYQSLYFERLSKFVSTGGKMLWQVGIDYRYVSDYTADGYMPPLGLFYRQFSHELEDYHRFDFFVNINIKRARFYLKYSLLNSAINKNYYFSGPYYPEPEPIFKFGLAWTFYD